MYGSIGAPLASPSSGPGVALPRGFSRDIASLAFQISPRDVFCAVTYIPQYVGYSERARPMTATRKKYITLFPLKKQI